MTVKRDLQVKATLVVFALSVLVPSTAPGVHGHHDQAERRLDHFCPDARIRPGHQVEHHRRAERQGVHRHRAGRQTGASLEDQIRIRRSQCV